MRKLAIALALLCASSAQAKTPRNQWGRTPAQERAVMAKILNCCKAERAANERRLTRSYGPIGSLTRAMATCADYTHGWVVDDQRDQAHWYYCVPAEKTPAMTCATDPTMAKSPGQVCVATDEHNLTYQQALVNVTECSVTAPGYTPSVELDTDGTWRAYCVPPRK